MHPDSDFLVNIKVTAKKISTGEVLDSNEAQVFTSEPMEEYTFEQDRHVLPESFNTISHTGEVLVANSKRPNGDFLTYTVTNVVSSNPDVVSVMKDGSDWTYYTVAPGTATMTVTYKDVAGKKQTYTFDIHVDTDVYEVVIDSPDGLAALPQPYGCVKLEGSVIHATTEGTEVISTSQLPEDIDYEWSLEKGDEEYAYIDDSEGAVEVYFIPETPDWTTAGVTLSLSKGGDVICSNSLAVHCSHSYSTLTPASQTLDLQVGNSMEMTLNTMVYNMEEPMGIPAENVEYTWEYDADDVIVENLSGNQFKIIRVTGEETYLAVNAEWVDANGDPQYDLAFYDLPYISTDLEDYEILLDDESAFEWPKIPVETGEKLTLDDLSVSVICDDAANPLDPDKYDLKVYYYDEDTDTKEEITTGDLAVEYNKKDPSAGYCDFVIQAVPSAGSPYTGETSEYAGLTLCDDSSLSKLNATVSFDEEYEAFNMENWHPYYQIPADNPPAAGPEVLDVYGDPLVEGSDYDITYYKKDAEYTETNPLAALPAEPGHYFAKITGTGDYTGTTYIDFDIGKENPMSATSKMKTVKKKKLKKKARTVSGVITVKDAQGTLSYESLGGNAKSEKALSVNPDNGKIKVKKKTKKGTYSIDVLVCDEGSDEYFAAYDIVTVKIKVK